jgi:hypothetical protein
MNSINIYLAHYNSTNLMTMQVNLIRKFFRYDISKSSLNIFGFVDSPNPQMTASMRSTWQSLNVTPIDLPPNRDPCISKSYGLAFQYIYDNYIKNDTYISIFMENDIFPIRYIDIEKYVEGYKMCGEIRYDGSFLPKDRMMMHWVGLQFFNHQLMAEKELYSGLCTEVKSLSGSVYSIDAGGTSYYWLMHNENYKQCRHISTIGCSPGYSPYTSSRCEVHNITSDIENLPEILREKYNQSFRVVNYENMFIHLEEMRLSNPHASMKRDWFECCYEKLMNMTN